MSRIAHAARVALVVIGSGLPAGAAAQSTAEAFLGEFSQQFEASASKLVALARAMPASSYDWSPGDGVASVARVYMHIARYNYMYPHKNMNRDSPVSRAEYEGWEDGVSDKKDVVAILERSMSYVRGVVEAMDAEDVGRSTMLYGRNVDDGAVLFQLVAHMNEHLGQSIAYARMNGVTPPWSR